MSAPALTPNSGHNLADAREFLRLLDPAAKSFTFQTFDDVVLPDGKKRGDKALVRLLHGSLEEHAAELIDLNSRGAGVFVAINATDSKGRKKINITKVRAIWHEDDKGLDRIFPLPPNLIIETSPRKKHRYWFVDELMLPEHAELMRTMVEVHGSDPAAALLTQVLRLPGFFHNKDPERSHLVRIIGGTAWPLGIGTPEQYTRDKVLTSFGFVRQERPEKVTPERAPGSFDRPKLLQAVTFIPADDREVWLRVGMALHYESGGSLEGRDVWSFWSENAPRKYDATDLERVWDSFKGKGGELVTGGTIYRIAKAHGWRDSKPPEQIYSEHEPKPSAPASEAPQTPRIKATAFQWREPATIEPREWLYGNHLIRKFLSATVAPGGMGKTQLIIAERLALATGRPLLGETTKQGRVWYWNGEDPRDELDRRFLATCLHYGISQADLEGRLFVDSGRDTPIVIAREERAGLVIAEPVVAAVIAAIKENGIDVFTVDPFVSSHEVSENDNAKINAVARQWAAIADECNCAIELVHHVRKTGGAEITVEDARGASALHDAARSMRALNRMSEDEAKKAGIDNPRLYFRTDDANNKISMKPPASGATWFKLESVGLGNQRADRPEDSVGVATRWKWPDAHAGLPSDVEQIVQAAVNSGMWRASPQADEWVGNKLAEVLGLDAEEKQDRARLKTIIADYIKRGLLEKFTASDENGDDRPFVRVKKQPS